MSKFKAGQKVRVVKGKYTNQLAFDLAPEESIGKSYEITEISQVSDEIYKLSNSYWYYESWLEAVEDNAFSSLLELYRWLLEGNKIKHKPSNIIIRLEEEKLVYLDAQLWGEIADPTYYERYTEPKWYENIPEHGIFCWRWDTYPYSNLEEAKADNSFALIKEYGSSGGFSTGSSIFWDNAEPMTLEEIKKYIWECQK